MSYMFYINGNKIQLTAASPIAKTFQVNDLARLDSRQSSFTYKFIVPFTAVNVKAMEGVYLVGNKSNVPYQKNEAMLFDESGVCLIYKGWAVVKSSAKGYEINVYDGLIDFYRAIENKTLTDVDISGLNHAKSITNIVNSWNNTEPYFYAISDYNGKNKFTTTGGTDIEINTDYQIPSARISYIWDRVFAFAGFTYSGSYFLTQDFLNLFMTFPKPVPTLVPHRILIHGNTYTPRSSVAWNPNELGPGLGGWHTYYLLTLPRSNFASPYANVNNYGATTPITGGGFVYDHNNINILQAGTYSLDIPLNVSATYYRRDAANNLIEFGNVLPDPTNTFKTFLFVCAVGDKIGFLISEPDYVMATLTFEWSFNRIDGFEANFEEAFVEFGATAFVNEIMQRGALTAFKDKYTNHIEFLTMSEILGNPNPIDWSDKFRYKDSENYQIGRYAKRNLFKYRYNGENETHNNGAILINDENLEDEIDVLNSKIYSPEAQNVIMLNRSVKVFKIWDKELRDDLSVDYKELTGRFYFLRFEMVGIDTVLASEKLNDQLAVSVIAMSNYADLSFNQIITKNYPAIVTILNKAKILDAYLYLQPRDVEAFTFKKPIYLEQLGSYYLVNKINAFIKNKITKCEVIEIDYKKYIPVITPPDNGTYITITNIESSGCNFTITFITDAVFPVEIRVVGAADSFGGVPDPSLQYDATVNAVTNSITVTVLNGGFWSFSLFLEPLGSNIQSNYVNATNFGECTFDPPAPSNFITITSVSTISVIGNTRKVRVNFTTDFPLPMDLKLLFSYVGTVFEGFTQIFTGVSGGFIIFDALHSDPFLGMHYITIYLSSGGIFLTDVYSNAAVSNP